MFYDVPRLLILRYSIYLYRWPIILNFDKNFQEVQILIITSLKLNFAHLLCTRQSNIRSKMRSNFIEIQVRYLSSTTFKTYTFNSPFKTGQQTASQNFSSYKTFFRSKILCLKQIIGQVVEIFYFWMISADYRVRYIFFQIYNQQKYVSLIRFMQL